MDEFRYQIRIPKDRIAVLIGKNGEVKKNLEALTNTRIKIDSHEYDIEVTGEDPIALYCLKDVVKAIGRGFNPDVAQLLLKQDYAFEIMDLDADVKPTQLERVKGRIIGKDGKARRNIEGLTDTFISVYGRTISIIGRAEDVIIVRRAIESLIQGSRHATVYKSLEKMKRNQKIQELELKRK
jgi:ribosomal RNA assembly protein